MRRGRASRRPPLPDPAHQPREDPVVHHEPDGEDQCGGGQGEGPVHPEVPCDDAVFVTIITTATVAVTVAVVATGAPVQRRDGEQGGEEGRGQERHGHHRDGLHRRAVVLGCCGDPPARVRQLRVDGGVFVREEGE